MNTITLLASIPAILGVVNLAKGLGLPSKAAAPLAAGLGVLFGVLDAVFTATAPLTGQGYYSAAAGGLLLGLGAVGLYDAAKSAGATVLGGSPTTVVAESPNVIESGRLESTGTEAE